MKHWILTIGTSIAAIGIYYARKYFKSQQKIKRRQAGNTKSQQPIPATLEYAPYLQDVALCLVVPAYIVNNIKEEYPITAYEIKKLIDKASYFICIQLLEADSIQQNLKLIEENMPNLGEMQEVYIRINIPNGQEMIGKTSTYILKRNLPFNGQGIVRKIACLNYLSGLEQFNRV